MFSASQLAHLQPVPSPLLCLRLRGPVTQFVTGLFFGLSENDFVISLIYFSDIVLMVVKSPRRVL